MMGVRKYAMGVWLLMMTVFWGLLFSVSAEAARFTVVIDAGHGGSDRGVQLSRNVHEKDVTLAVARMIQEILSNNEAISAVLTRADDRELTQDARLSVVKAANADLFVSLHINAGFGMKASGYEIYFNSLRSSPEKKTDRKQVIDDMLETTYMNNSIRFSNIADKELGRLFPREGRGLRPAPVGVLGNLTMPGVLIELGFASNIKNRDALLEKRTQENVAKMLAESIRLYFGVPPS